MSKIQLSKTFILNTVKLALNEDLYPSGDITSSLVENDKSIKIKLIANQSAIVGGLLFGLNLNILLESLLNVVQVSSSIPRLSLSVNAANALLKS